MADRERLDQSAGLDKHLCLQVGVVDEVAGNRDHLPRSTQQPMDYNKSPQRMLHQSDLDQFMVINIHFRS